MFKQFAHFLVIALFFWVPGSALALDDQWYIGIGGGQSFLDPEPADATISVVDGEDGDTAGTLFIGRDVGDVVSVQLQAWTLGESPLTDGETIEFSALEGSILYRFYDSRDRRLTEGGFGIALYGRVGLGFVDRDIGGSLELEETGDVYFGGGIGAELFITDSISLRLEGSVLDRDSSVATLAAVYRFGGSANQLLRVPESTPESTPDPVDPDTVITLPVLDEDDSQDQQEELPQETIIVADTDLDGIADDIDECAASRAGYPVRDNGCSLLNGVLSGVTFVGKTAVLESTSAIQLDYLADLLQRYPDAGIQLLAHTDSSGCIVVQATLMRNRLKTVGTYLVQRGVSARRMTLRSLGSESPRFDNATETGRSANNRIEILERE